jgi:type I restriction enzyme R subunit
MNTTMMSEDEWEHFALDTLAEWGWAVKSGQEIGPGSGEREKWDELHIPSRMLNALAALNPLVPVLYLKQAPRRSG